MAFDTPPPAIGYLQLCERGEKAGRGPAFLVRFFRELEPHLLHGGQSQFGQEKFDTCGVDGGGLRHAAASKAWGWATTASSS